MRRILATAVLLGGLAVIPAVDASAITIALETSSPVVDLGESFDVDLTISGLNAGAAPSLGVYDVDVLFDASVAALTGVAVGDPVLGDQLSFVFPSIAFDQPIGGGVNVFELSLDLSADLVALQADAFTLVRLTFDAVAVGTTEFVPGIVVAGDQLGDPLSIDTLIGTQVRTQTGTQGPVIPEPSALVLFGLGLAVLHVRRDRALARSPIT